MKKCSRCGCINPDDAVFCSNCGDNMNDDETKPFVHDGKINKNNLQNGYSKDAQPNQRIVRSSSRGNGRGVTIDFNNLPIPFRIAGLFFALSIIASFIMLFVVVSTNNTSLSVGAYIALGVGWIAEIVIFFSKDAKTIKSTLIAISAITVMVVIFLLLFVGKMGA